MIFFWVLLAMIMLFTGFISAGLLWKNPFRRRNSTDDFLASEANRRLYHMSEAPPGWSSRGRMYTKGLAVVRYKNGECRFVKQVMLCDIGILE